MRQVHSYSVSSAASTTGQYGLRGKIEKKSEKKDYDCYRQCPVDKCYKVVLHLPQHLKSVHKIQKGEEYFNLLYSAKKISTELMPKNILTSPKKLYGDLPTDFTLNKTKKLNPFIKIEHKSFIKELTYESSINDEESLSDSKNTETSSDEEYTIPLRDDIKEKTLSNYVENLLNLFFNFMTGSNHGCKQNSVTEIVRDARRILIEVGVYEDISIAFDKNLATLEKKYIQEYCKKKDN
ncbi:uncharacterized protein LOC105848460 [Hydra vulgaris]|uniref:uncharacterized protein LOC105848460 n=1 Tax=Hydra vulgaris TaxID=6087 RepID=UPI001F5EE23B|nr:uncharacterized protein LOC105848460 [Hydra vulgaris]